MMFPVTITFFVVSITFFFADNMNWPLRLKNRVSFLLLQDEKSMLQSVEN